MKDKYLKILVVVCGIIAISGEILILLRTNGYDQLFFELGALILGMGGISIILIHMCYKKVKQYEDLKYLLEAK